MKKEDFLGALLGNPARGRLIRVFVFDELQAFSAAKAAERGSVGLKVAQKELKALEQMGIIKRKVEKQPKGRKRGEKPETAWILNQDFKYVRPLSLFIHEVAPISWSTIVRALRPVGRLSVIVASGCFTGDPSRPVDLIVAADNLNEERLDHCLKAYEPVFGREIRYSAFSTPEFRYRLTIQDRLIRDTLDYPHYVLLDRAHLLR